MLVGGKAGEISHVITGSVAVAQFLYLGVAVVGSDGRALCGNSFANQLQCPCPVQVRRFQGVVQAADVSSDHLDMLGSNLRV